MEAWEIWHSVNGVTAMPAEGSGVFTGESKEEHRCGSALGNRRRSRTDEEAAASLSLQYTV